MFVFIYMHVFITKTCNSVSILVIIMSIVKIKFMIITNCMLTYPLYRTDVLPMMPVAIGMDTLKCVTNCYTSGLCTLLSVCVCL